MISKTSVTYRQIWLIAYPIILNGIGQLLINIVDTAFLSRVGEVELGASTIGGLMYFIFVIIGIGFSTGTQIIIARRAGENKNAEIGTTLDNSLVFLCVLGLVFTLVIVFFSPLLLSLIISSNNIIKATNTFLSIRAVGLIFAYITFGFRAFFIGIEKTMVITWSTIIMTIVNIFFNYVLIFGYLGFPALGIAGSATASLISEFVATLVVLIYTYKKINRSLYNLFSFSLITFSRIKKTLILSLPIMFQGFFSMTAWFTFFIFIESMGEHALAISTLARSMYFILIAPMIAFGATTNTLVSNAIGRNEYKQVMAIIYKITSMCLLITLIPDIIIAFFPKIVLLIYTNNVQLINDAIPVVHVITIAAIFLSVAFVIFNGISGTGKTIVSLWLEFIVLIIYLIFGYILIKIIHAPIELVWTCEILYGILLSVFSWLYLLYGKWHTAKV